MSSILGDKLQEALSQKETQMKNDINSFIWKGPRKYVNNKRVQEEFKLIDCDLETLKKCYAHCESMLYSKDKDDPGRYELINIIRDQQLRCFTELYTRHLRKNGSVMLEFRKSFIDYLTSDEVKDVIPRSAYGTTPISSVLEVPEEYRSVTIELLLASCLQALGMFRRKHITNNFLTKMGLWFTKEEIKEYLSQKDEDGNPKDRLEQVIENLNLRPGTRLHTDYEKGLSYLEFRAVYMLKNERYETIGDLALRTLAKKVLPFLEDEARKQAELWEQKMTEIEMVCEHKGWTLD